MNRSLRSLDNSTIVRIMRRALTMLIPILMVGSFSLIVRSFPVLEYQLFIKSLAGGAVYDICGAMYNATFNSLSVYTAMCIGVSVGREYSLSGTSAFTICMVSLLSFLVSAGAFTDGFDYNYLSGVGMFTAILCSLLGSYIYLHFGRGITNKRVFSDGSNLEFNQALAMIVPTAAISIFFAVINQICMYLFSVKSICDLFVTMFSSAFLLVGNAFFEGFLYVLISSLLWFFGLHGSNMLETVSRNVFVVAQDVNAQAIANGLEATEIYTKTFLDVFVYMGGCGTLLALIIASLLFSKSKSNKTLSKIALFPVLFNINELMLFGLPIIFNPIMFIPFIGTPIVTFLISAFATNIGWVPIAINSVEWTTPIILGGYQATGSIAGSILQLINLAVGVIIYLPFIKIYERKKQQEAVDNMAMLIDYLVEAEKSTRPIFLTEINGSLGDISKLLVNDLKRAIKRDEIEMYYQPQFQRNSGLIGAEALLRWNHPIFGFIPPNLIIQLSKETGDLVTLEKLIFTKVNDDIKRIEIPFTICINVTPTTIRNQEFVFFIKRMFPHLSPNKMCICIEITEQSELLTDDSVTETLFALKKHGFKLAIDDFSMGSTSLKYLSDSQFDVVKLDGSLVRGLDNPRNKEIISSIVHLSKSLGFSVLAEYVETQEQCDGLEEIGCNQYQGYLYSKPLPLTELLEFIKNRK